MEHKRQLKQAKRQAKAAAINLATPGSKQVVLEAS